MYTKALAFGNNALCIQDRARVYERIKQYDKAKTDITRAISLNHGDPTYILTLVRVNIGLSEYDEAFRNLVIVGRFAPWNREAKRQMGQLAQYFAKRGKLALDNKQIDEASVFYELGVAADPENKLAHYGKGRVAYGFGDYTTAIEHFKKAAELDPSEFAYYESIDWVYAKMRYRELGIKLDFTQWTDWDCAPRSYSNGAIEMWEKYLEKKPEDGRAWLMKARAEYCSGGLDVALVDAQASLERGYGEANGRYAMIKQELAGR